MKINTKRRMKAMEDQLVALIQEDQEKLYRMAYSYVKNKEDALDVVQDTVYKAYKSVGKIEEPKYMRTWLTRILINTALDACRKSGREVEVEDDTLAYLHSEQSESAPQNQVADKLVLRDALAQLSSKQQAIIILRFFEDRKLEEIAAVLETPLGTVKSLLYRALGKLRIQLEEVDFNE